MKKILLFAALIFAFSCRVENNNSNLVIQLQNYLEAKAAKDNSHWQYMADTVRSWFDEKTGAGNIQLKGVPASGIWTEWDQEMNPYIRYDSLIPDDENHSVSGIFYEFNDFYRLIGKGPTKTIRTYWFDKNNMVEEILIVWSPENTLTADHLVPVVNWALKNDSIEISELYKEEKIIPSLESAKRWKTLLRKYKASF